MYIRKYRLGSLEIPKSVCEIPKCSQYYVSYITFSLDVSNVIISLKVHFPSGHTEDLVYRVWRLRVEWTTVLLLSSNKLLSNDTVKFIKVYLWTSCMVYGG